MVPLLQVIEYTRSHRQEMNYVVNMCDIRSTMDTFSLPCTPLNSAQLHITAQNSIPQIKILPYVSGLGLRPGLPVLEVVLLQGVNLVASVSESVSARIGDLLQPCLPGFVVLFRPQWKSLPPHQSGGHRSPGACPGGSELLGKGIGWEEKVPAIQLGSPGHSHGNHAIAFSIDINEDLLHTRTGNSQWVKQAQPSLLLVRIREECNKHIYSEQYTLLSLCAPGACSGQGVINLRPKVFLVCRFNEKEGCCAQESDLPVEKKYVSVNIPVSPQ